MQDFVPNISFLFADKDALENEADAPLSESCHHVDTNVPVSHTNADKSNKNFIDGGLKACYSLGRRMFIDILNDLVITILIFRPKYEFDGMIVVSFEPRICNHVVRMFVTV